MRPEVPLLYILPTKVHTYMDMNNMYALQTSGPLYNKHPLLPPSPHPTYNPPLLASYTAIIDFGSTCELEMVYGYVSDMQGR